MSQECRTVSGPARPNSVVVRPSTVCCRYCGHNVHPFEVLVFYADGGVRALDLSTAPPTCSQIPLSGLQLSDVSASVYEPTTDCIVAVEQKSMLMRLNRDGHVSIIAGTSNPAGPQERVDGRGEAARFKDINSLVADGLGNVYVAEAKCIRKLAMSTGEVSTLEGSTPFLCQWISLAYDATGCDLLAATNFAVCRIVTAESTQTAAASRDSTSAADAPFQQSGPRLIAGSWRGQPDYAYNSRGELPACITSILARSDRKLYVLEGAELKLLDLASGLQTPKTLHDHTIYGPTMRWTSASCMAALPTGELALCGGGYINALDLIPVAAPVSSPSLKRKRSLATDFLSQMAVPAVAPAAASPDEEPTAGGVDDSGGYARAVTVRFDDGRGFLTHSSVLAACSDYFKQLLTPDGGFLESGAGEVRLRDTTADVFGCLLAYMYGNALAVPDEQLLRPVAELAGRLLMPVECIAQLQALLLEAVTPGSVVSDLVWAQQYGMPELVTRLKAYLLKHRKQAAFGGGGGLELAAKFPELAAELLGLMATA